jgi:tRNA pseudouridine38-40 synthase
MSSVRLRVDIGYDGAPFAGFARQPGRRTVQGDLEAALERVFGQPAVTTGAGRTDRGVHALAQVVHLDLDPQRGRGADTLAACEVLRTRLDALVGDAISVWRLRIVADHFDARFSATRRGYRYRLVDRPEAADPVRANDRWRVDAPLDLAAMRAGSRWLLGEHDFASFCRRAPGRTTVRRIDEISISRPGPGRIHVRLAAPAFCHQQVRSIVGCLVEVGRGRRPASWIGEVLAAGDRSVAARVAPAHGLTLERVSYGRVWPAAPPAAVREALHARLA